MRVVGEGTAEPGLGRRGFLRFGFTAAAAVTVPSIIVPAGVAEAAVPPPAVRRLALHNVNTGERFNDIYWADGAYRPEAMRRLDVLLRDHRAGQVARFDPRLLDLLADLHRRMDSDEPFRVICGYRSRRTNALARRRSRGVAKESYHTRAMAVDVALPDRSLKGLALEAKRMQAGGVGVYARSGFVHVDVGPVRTW